VTTARVSPGASARAKARCCLDRIWENGIRHLLTVLHRPTTTGKVEPFGATTVDVFADYTERLHDSAYEVPVQSPPDPPPVASASNRSASSAVTGAVWSRVTASAPPVDGERRRRDPRRQVAGEEQRGVRNVLRPPGAANR
jgi:hypothetical protein